jgi:hypothetical protein
MDQTAQIPSVNCMGTISIVFQSPVRHAVLSICLHCLHVNVLVHMKLFW